MVVQITGRLDAAWADHLLGTIRNLVREGHHHVRLDASGLEYLSSAGIRSLLRIRREIQAVSGQFGIAPAAPFVQETLRVSGLEALLWQDEPPPAPTPPDPTESKVAKPAAQPTQPPTPKPADAFEIHTLDATASLTVHTHNRWHPWLPLNGSELLPTPLQKPRFGLGIGAAGKDTTDITSRLGDFAAAAGSVVWLPSDDNEQPDYLEQTERFIPQLHTIQAIIGEGSFSHLIRFQPTQESPLVTASALFERVLDTTRSDSAALVALAEAEGLVGASLARSPGLIQPHDSPGQFPDIREWLSFCGERVHRQSLVLLVAFVTRNPSHPLAPLLTPSPSSPGLLAHAHAAVLAFRPLPQGILQLDPTVAAIMEDNNPTALLHLIDDDRPTVGLGQSAFLRGACWCGPIHPSTSPLS